VHVDATLGLLVTATAVNGMMVGATLDQSIKQLPARHRIGPLAYAAYAKAADFSNGVRWYPALAAATLLTTLGAATTGLLNHPTGQQTAALITAVAGTAGHMLVTARAAPTFLSLRHTDDEPTITAILSRFARLQTLRAALQVGTAAATVWALIATITPG